MAAVFPALEPNHKGAAISVYNLSAGLSNFLAPAIAVVLLPYFSTIGVVIAYTALYILAFFLCPLIRVEQPGFYQRSACETVYRQRGRVLINRIWYKQCAIRAVPPGFLPYAIVTLPSR